MNPGNENGRRRKSWGPALVALWLAACGGVIGQPTVGGESHFLRHCGDGCGKGLECVSDICTRSCRIDEASSCNQLSSAARCTNTSIEPGAIAVCDQACSRDQDCSPLGADFTCRGGYCRGPALSSSPSGSAGASSHPAGNGGGGAQSAGSGGDGAQPASSGSGGTPTSSGGTPTGSGGGPEAPPALCQLRFDGGLCDANFTVYTAVGGECIRTTFGGCGGNANRFNSLEECESVCEQRPSIQPCTDGRVEREICLECGPAGGCGRLMRVCAMPCTENAACTGLPCWDGFCQAGGCY